MIQDVFNYPKAHFLFIGGIAFISETSFVTCSEDGYLKRWELSEEQNPQIVGPLCEVQASDAFSGVNDVCYHPKQKIVITCGDDYKIRLWHPENLEALGVLEGHTDYVSRIAVTDKLLLSSSKDETIGVWDLEKRQLIKKLEGHETWVYGLTVSPDQKKAAAVSVNHRIIIWDLESLTEAKRITEGTPAMLFLNGLYVEYLEDRSAPALGHEYYPPVIRWYEPESILTAYREIICWDAETGNEKFRRPTQPYDFNSMVCLQDLLITVSSVIKGWRMPEGHELFEISGHNGRGDYCSSFVS